MSRIDKFTPGAVAPVTPEQQKLDERFMAMAMMLARRGLGSTMPNPAVGAVVVGGVVSRAAGEPSTVLGRGWTQPGGRPHAEPEALRRAGERAGGAALYVTLEPCSHHGRSPPCADAIVAAGIKRVVVAIADPDERVAGRGIARLRDAGITVDVGTLADEARWLTAGHILRVTRQRPFVQLKLAVSADDRIAPGTGAPVWVTGNLARQRGHLLRAQADAILVGRGTLEADDPDLTCRLPGMEGLSPVRVVLDSHLNISARARLVTTAAETPTIVITSREAMTGERVMALEKQGVQLLSVPGGTNGLAPKEVLAQLAQRGVTRLLIEGGPAVACSFLRVGLVDEVVLFRGKEALGADGLLPLGEAGVVQFADQSLWRQQGTRELNGDKMTLYQNRRSATMLPDQS